MAYKWGLPTTYKSWDDPPSRGRGGGWDAHLKKLTNSNTTHRH